MNRFQYEKENTHDRKNLISIIIFLLLIFIFYCGISFISLKNDHEQRAYLEQTLQRSIVHCYAVEGSYPESLAYLKEHYGVTYDSSKYFVDYQISGSNLMPDITIIEK
ncbi:hypothetical protein ACTQ6A_15275 [Lachnospiraceae bacterium LCP25S3_G4]